MIKRELKNLSLARDDSHRYVYSAQEIEETFDSPLLHDVIGSPAFNRLKSINFLGAIDYLLPEKGKRPSKRHSRYQHSLAVAGLAKLYCELMDYEGSDFNYFVVSALLHDIGHAPLSHSLEPVFRSRFEIDHHVSGEKIIRGDVEIGRKLARTLVHHDINNFRVMSIIAGVDEPKFNDLFSRSINVDTIEAILRSNSYIYENDLQLTAPRVIQALVEGGSWGEEVLDAFWERKEDVYGTLIQSRMGFMADYVCKRYMEVHASNFRESYYYGTEAELKADHGELFGILERLGEHQVIPDYLVPDGQEIACTRRTFYIDPKVKLTDGQSINLRYRQKKRPMKFEFRKVGGWNEFGEIGEHQGSLGLL